MTLPVRDLLTLVAMRPGRVTSGAGGAAGRRVREWSAEAVDDWGRDPQLTTRVASLSRLRWSVAVTGSEQLPATNGGLIVVNARRLGLVPVMTALALGGRVQRPVRFVGRPDTAPIGPLLQRLGGLLPQPVEIETALARGELVVIGALHRGGDSVATVDHRMIGAALAAKVRVFPAAAVSSPVQREARITIGAPVRPRRIRRGPLAELELADAVAQRIDTLLAELGGTRPASVVDRLPIDRLVGVVAGALR